MGGKSSKSKKNKDLQEIGKKANMESDSFNYSNGMNLSINYKYDKWKTREPVFTTNTWLWAH